MQWSSSSATLLLSSSLLVFFIISAAEAVIILPDNETVAAVVAFGDSIVDTGNNNYLLTIAKCNFPPYGRDFPGGKPTGRFSNGKVPSDFIAEELGIKELLPAYMDPTLQPEDLLTGVSFASGGSGYDPLTSKIVSAAPLADQLRQFKEYTEKLKGSVGGQKTSYLLEKGLFVVVASSNDIANTYFNLHARDSQYDIFSYTDLLVALASNFVEGLYELGARRIGVFGAPPLGCIPSSRTLAGGMQRECNEAYNQAAQLYNSKLSSRLDSLSQIWPHGRAVYVDIYNPLLDIIENHRSYGFEVANKGCCGTGEIEASVLCNQLDPDTCTNASSYVFWDSYHPTEATYRLLVSRLLEEYAVKLL